MGRSVGICRLVDRLFIERWVIGDLAWATGHHSRNRGLEVTKTVELAVLQAPEGRLSSEESKKVVIAYGNARGLAACLDDESVGHKSTMLWIPSAGEHPRWRCRSLVEHEIEINQPTDER
jgi:hypothetical protein